MSETEKAESTAMPEPGAKLDALLTRRRSQEGLKGLAKNRAAMFQKVEQDHLAKQLENPFSEVGGTKVAGSALKKIDKNDPTYGKPLKGSVTEQRGNAANSHIQKEIAQLCQIIYDLALEDPNVPGPDCWVKFGPLFEHYNRVSDKLVGILLRARKYAHVDFPGEILYQRRDDDVKIFLTPSGMKIRKY